MVYMHGTVMAYLCVNEGMYVSGVSVWIYVDMDMDVDIDIECRLWFVVVRW